MTSLVTTLPTYQCKIQTDKVNHDCKKISGISTFSVLYQCLPRSIILQWTKSLRKFIWSSPNFPRAPRAALWDTWSPRCTNHPQSKTKTLLGPVWHLWALKTHNLTSGIDPPALASTIRVMVAQLSSSQWAPKTLVFQSKRSFTGQSNQILRLWTPSTQ